MAWGYKRLLWSWPVFVALLCSDSDWASAGHTHAPNMSLSVCLCFWRC
eukprot:jgi/Botrbrau1/12803/Bobra.117_1s0019.1